jgi:putative ABC transport system substrate-binding protein
MQCDRLRRCEFITLLGSAAAWPHMANAQQPIARTGVSILMPGPAAHSVATLDPFYRGLHDLGYIVGQNLTIERRMGIGIRIGFPRWRLNWLCRRSI